MTTKYDNWDCDIAVNVDSGYACGAVGFTWDDVEKEYICTFCAPIFRKWFLGKSAKNFREVIDRKKWKVTI